MTEVWLKSEEVETLTGWTVRKIQREAERGKLKWRHAQDRKPNGRRSREYLADSLPMNFKLDLIKRGVIKSATEPSKALVKSAPVAGRAEIVVFGKDSQPSQKPRIVLPDPEAQAQAEQRLAAIMPLLEYAQLSTPVERMAWCSQRSLIVKNTDDLASQIAASQGCTRSSIWRWVKNYRTDGFAALADRIRSDKGVSRWSLQSDQHEELANLACFAVLQENLSVKMAWEIVKCRAHQFGLEPPSYETVRQIIEHVPGPVKTLALEGRRKYDEVFAEYLERAFVDLYANEVWVSDHMIHDVLVQNDLFDQKEREHMRLRFTGLLCMRTRRFVAYAWSQEGSSRSIVTCLRHALFCFGPPRQFYCDNGKDYQKVGRGARGGVWHLEEIPSEALGVIARLDIAMKYCQPFHPQAKLIERANNTIHQRWDRRFVTYTGPTPEQRPDRCIAALERHKKLLAQGRPDESDLPLASDFVRSTIAWIEGEYHRMSKDVRGMENITPLQAFEAYPWPAQKPAPRPEVLIPLLAERKKCTVRDSSVQIFGRRYRGADDLSRKAMHDVTGQEVTVLFDSLDPEYIAVCDNDGHLLAHLEPKNLLRQSDDDETRAAIADSMQERRRRYHDTRDQLDELSRRVLSSGYVPQNDQMIQLGKQLPIDVTAVVVHRPQLKPKADKSAVAPPSAAEIAANFFEETA